MSYQDKKEFTFGFSPCPNDTFLFNALVNNKIDTEGLKFDFVIADVEELNKRAFSDQIDITKISFGAFLKLTSNYMLFNSGCALGINNGPLIISQNPLKTSELSDKTLAIPGYNTTANFLVSVLFPEINNKKEMLFSDIEQAVISGHTDIGLIIHESRFTYSEKGLHKVADLGEEWHKNTNAMLPLGGIIGSRKIDHNTLLKIDRIITRSVQYAFENPDSGKDFIKCHAQETSDKVINQHIKLYVNEFSQQLGTNGREAVLTFFAKAVEKGIITTFEKDLFINQETK